MRKKYLEMDLDFITNIRHCVHMYCREHGIETSFIYYESLSNEKARDKDIRRNQYGGGSQSKSPIMTSKG